MLRPARARPAQEVRRERDPREKVLPGHVLRRDEHKENELRSAGQP